MEYSISVSTKRIALQKCLQDFYFPGRFLHLCEACPDYNRRWSCPPDLPNTRELLAEYTDLTLIGVQVFYDAQMRAQTDPKKVERLRQESYGQMKKVLLEALLGMEQAFGPSLCIAAGRCEQCARCSRVQGLPCRKPERMRYSFSGLGFDLTHMAKALLQIDLLWDSQRLPTYDVALAAICTKEK